MSGTERFPTAQAALEYRQMHDKRVKVLNRMAMPTLRDLERGYLPAGIVRVSGGPQSRDELINAILATEYPVALMNESNHVAYHQAGENWSACEYCGAER